MASSPVTTDEALLDRMTGGDPAAFEMLYERRHLAIFRYAFRMSGSEALAEDVTQEVFMALIRDCGKFDPARGTVASYLYGVARHRLLTRLARERRFVPIAIDPADDEGESDTPDTADDPLAELIRSRAIDSIRQAVLALPVHYREVVVLCDLQEINYAEAATILDCAVGTVRSRLHRARGMLVERLRSLAPAVSHRVSSENVS